MSLPNRRHVLKSGVASSLALCTPPTLLGKSSSNAIIEENRRSGTQDWMLAKTRIDESTKYRCPWVEGYASHCSIGHGETLQLMISTLNQTSVAVQIYRLGYYDGNGGRLIRDMGQYACRSQPMPEPSARHLMNCQWEPTLELKVGDDWTSGVFVAKLTEQTEGLESYIIFIVKDDRRSELVFQCSDHTWQAYNRWPSQYSLYDMGKQEWYWGDEAAVSFNRPYGKYCQILDQPLSIGSGEFFLWEFPFVFWMEQHGYDASYISNFDLHQDANHALRCKGFISIGHDEYWTIEMFRNAQSAIQSGVSFGFFSGNAVCGRIEYDTKSRSFHRVGVFGPPTGINEIVGMNRLWHEHPYANELMGAHSFGPVTGGADWICTLPDHWLYKNTGMKLGDRIPGVIGWEWHGDPAPIEGLQVVATGETQSAPGKLNGGIYTATTYPGPKDNVVFNASTCWWADGLSKPPGYISPSVYTSPQGPHRWIQQMTENVLNKMLHR